MSETELSDFAANVSTLLGGTPLAAIDASVRTELAAAKI